MEPAAMLAQLATDGAALRAAAVDLDAEVPTCPGWTVGDAVEHTATVYAHKATIVEQSLDGPPPNWPPTFEFQDVRDFYDDQLHRVIEALRTRDPATSVWTWYPPEQTVGFWVRRMMQETVIHRADVESASGLRPEIPHDVGVDGINELFERMLCADDPEFYEGTPPGRGERVAIKADGSAWTIRLGPDVASFTREAEPDVDVTVEGEAGLLLLAVWNRLPYSEVTVTGDERALTTLQALVAAATQ